jgi:hypothetical protein
MTTLCTTLPAAKDKPQSVIDYYDNLTRILEYIRFTSEVIDRAAEDREDGISHVADMGTILTKEAYARAEALYKHMKNHQADAKEF